MQHSRNKLPHLHILSMLEVWIASRVAHFHGDHVVPPVPAVVERSTSQLSRHLGGHSTPSPSCSNFTPAPLTAAISLVWSSTPKPCGQAPSTTPTLFLCRKLRKNDETTKIHRKIRRKGIDFKTKRSASTSETGNISCGIWPLVKKWSVTGTSYCLCSKTGPMPRWFQYRQFQSAVHNVTLLRRNLL